MQLKVVALLSLTACVFLPGIRSAGTEEEWDWFKDPNLAAAEAESWPNNGWDQGNSRQMADAQNRDDWAWPGAEEQTAFNQDNNHVPKDPVNKQGFSPDDIVNNFFNSPGDPNVLEQGVDWNDRDFLKEEYEQGLVQDSWGDPDVFMENKQEAEEEDKEAQPRDFGSWSNDEAVFQQPDPEPSDPVFEQDFPARDNSERFDPEANSERYYPEANSERYYPEANSERYPEVNSERYPEANSERYYPEANSERYPEANSERYYPEVKSERYYRPEVNRFPTENADTEEMWRALNAKMADVERQEEERDVERQKIEEKINKDEKQMEMDEKEIKMLEKAQNEELNMADCECKGDCDLKYNPACKARKESKSEEIGKKIEIVSNDLNAIMKDLQGVAEKQKKDLGI